MAFSLEEDKALDMFFNSATQIADAWLIQIRDKDSAELNKMKRALARNKRLSQENIDSKEYKEPNYSVIAKRLGMPKSQIKDLFEKLVNSSTILIKGVQRRGAITNEEVEKEILSELTPRIDMWAINKRSTVQYKASSAGEVNSKCLDRCNENFIEQIKVAAKAFALALVICTLIAIATLGFGAAACVGAAADALFWAFFAAMLALLACAERCREASVTL